MVTIRPHFFLLHVRDHFLAKYTVLKKFSSTPSATLHCSPPKTPLPEDRQALVTQISTPPNRAATFSTSHAPLRLRHVECLGQHLPAITLANRLRRLHQRGLVARAQGDLATLAANPSAVARPMPGWTRPTTATRFFSPESISGNYICLRGEFARGHAQAEHCSSTIPGGERAGQRILPAHRILNTSPLFEAQCGKHQAILRAQIAAYTRTDAERYVSRERHFQIHFSPG